MKVTVIGVKRVKGVSAKNGSDFDMGMVMVLAPIDPVNNAKLQVSGHGYEVAEMALDPQAVEQFSGMRFPSEIELLTEARARQGQYVTYVVGVARPGVKVANG